MPGMAPQKVWLVTGASSGLGAAIAIAALQAGHKVIASARNPTKAALAIPEVEALGGQWLKLDITAKDVQQTVFKAIEKVGRIDTVVNNAGYILIGALEDLSDEEIDEQMTTNFLGHVRIIRAILPFMRTQRTGTIVNISSVFGFFPQPGASIYTASKHAIEGFTSSLAHELSSFNIRVALIEPGLFRTNVCKDARIPKISDAYVGTAVEQGQKLAEYCAKVPERMRGDPAKLAQRVLEFVEGTGLCAEIKGKGYMRLVVGEDALGFWRKQLGVLAENVDAMEMIARSTDV